MAFTWKASGLTYVYLLLLAFADLQLSSDFAREAGMLTNLHSYNKYLSVAARVVRRSLKDDKRIAAEKRGEMGLRFAKWNVSVTQTHPAKEGLD